jgi:hypothetical protein
MAEGISEEGIVILGVIVVGLFLAISLFSCGGVPQFDESDNGRSVEFSGKVSVKSAGGSYLSVGSGTNVVSVSVSPASQQYVAQSVETSDCVTIDGRVSVDGDSVSIENADIS